VPPRGILDAADNCSPLLDGRTDGAIVLISPTAQKKTKKRGGLRRWVSIQVAILKVLASHGSGRATLSSLKRDIAILSASGPDWNARLKRLARRAPAIDIFGSGYVLRDDEGWEITSAGRYFLRALEAVTQDNRPPDPSRSPERRKTLAARSSLSVIDSGAGSIGTVVRPLPRRATACRSSTFVEPCCLSRDLFHGCALKGRK
jgi:hypothetical protein